MTRAQRIALRLSTVLLCVASSLLMIAWHVGASPALAAAAAQAAPAATATFYGADTMRTLNAIRSIWPQARGPFCGIETSLAAVNYDDEVHGVAMRFTSTAAQNTVAARNQTSGASQWGYPRPVNSPCGGVTNISRDFGTDPRSIAYMTWNYTPNNTFYHD